MNHAKLLVKYVPIVDRVHGAHHPEFHEVKRLFELIYNKTKKNDKKPLIDEELKSLRLITNNYEIPNDVCETYEAVYQMLKEIDQYYYL